MRLLPLTTLTGQEWDPAFSPDGEQVAFAWNGPKQDNLDIYVTLVGSPDVRRLTSDPAEDRHPTWSPDGRQIAFLRARPGGTTIQIVSALGGTDRKLGDFRGADSLGWSPDPHWLAAGRSGTRDIAGQQPGIYLIPVEGGDPRLLIAPKGGFDSQPAFSPDGHRVAYVTCRHPNVSVIPGALECDIYLVELNAEGTASASPRRLTTQRSSFFDSIAWTRDGSAVVYAASPQAQPYLWRVGVDGTRPPERIEIAGPGATGPGIAMSRDRLAFTRDLSDLDIYRFEVGRPAQLVVGSTFGEMEPRLSADGRRLVFGSARSSGDTFDLWVADADGSNPQQLTQGPGRAQGSPAWSPDGRRIAFDSFAADDARLHIWMIDAEGGTPRRLTTQTGDEMVPTWSHDGRWIYFSSNQGTGYGIWRVSANGGTPEPVNRGASGPFACESADGRTLLFQPKDADSPLMAMSLTSGGVRELVPCVRDSAFGVGPQGVYYVPCDPSDEPSVHVMNLETERDQRLGTLEGLRPRPLGLAVSPDGKTILYPRLTRENQDLMLIENFR
jgi:Tol biopolymer transport system component